MKVPYATYKVSWESVRRFRRRRFLKVFFIIYGQGGDLGHVISIMLINFHFLVPESFHAKFGLECLNSF